MNGMSNREAVYSPQRRRDAEISAENGQFRVPQEPRLWLRSSGSALHQEKRVRAARPLELVFVFSALISASPRLCGESAPRVGAIT
jgi:hypothetical protein